MRALLAVLWLAAVAPVARADRVLMVGSYRGMPGQFTDVQAAINAAAPGDWILIGPGDYHERQTLTPVGARGDDRAGAAILITKPGLWLRGMNRNAVWIDGTRPGSRRCARADAYQDFGPPDTHGKPGGRNGILIYRARGVYVQNLSVCNFMRGELGGGDEIWWDGGGATGRQVNLGTWAGSYLTATSSFYADPSTPAAGYGIYASNLRGPGRGLFDHDYASNMSIAAFYVGACPDCNVTLDHVHGQDSPQGYSGTNAGGQLLVEHSEFDHNSTGISTGNLNNDDAPSPQDGACPGYDRNPVVPGGIQRIHVCTVFADNYVHDNNNANVIGMGEAEIAPLGTGIAVYGGRHDVFVHNRVVRNGAWGALLVPFRDTEPPNPIARCTGGLWQSPPSTGQPVCYYDDWGSELGFNTFTDDGFFGNPSNGDIAELSQADGPSGPNYHPDSNCFHNNVDTRGRLTGDPANIDGRRRCGRTYPPAGDGTLSAQVSCDSPPLGPCRPGTSTRYPQVTHIRLRPAPPQPTMPNPCAGVPASPWCSGQIASVRACVHGDRLSIPAVRGPRERLIGLAGRISGAPGARVVRRGARLSVQLIAGAHGSFQVKVSERISIRRHRELFSFTRIYRGC